MKIHLFFAIFILLFSNSVYTYAQNNFRKGYIISNENDTIAGFINYKTEQSNAIVCEFKKRENTKPQRFTPSQIAGYKLDDNDRHYTSKTIRVKGVDKVVFVEYLIAGKLNLYYYASETDFYLFEKPDGNIVYITQNPTVQRFDDDSQMLVMSTDKSYKGRLSYEFEDYPEIKRMVAKADFSRSSFVKIARTYNKLEGTENEMVFGAKKEKRLVALRFSAYTGMYTHNYEFYTKQLKEMNPTSHIAPLVGIQIGIMQPRLSESISMLVDISLSQLTSNSESKNTSFSQEFDFKASVLANKLGVRYTYPKGKVHPYVETGFAYNYAFNRSGTYHIVLSDVILPSSPKKYTILPERIMIGYFLGIGMDYDINKRHSIFLSTGYERLSLNSDVLKSFSLKAGYRF
ncbi:MAG: hypothetical protein RL662_1323 [Bacteroidota bacterium]|jgi:hypothetical protein